MVYFWCTFLASGFNHKNLENPLFIGISGVNLTVKEN